MSMLANKAAWLVVLMLLLCVGLVVGLVFGSPIQDADAAKTQANPGVTTKTSQAQTSQCTSPDVNSVCAPVKVKVPTGKKYHVTVFSSFAAVSTSSNYILYCPAIKGGSIAPTPRCITPTPASPSPDSISLAPNYQESAASSGEISSLPAGTYTFSTMIHPHLAIEQSPAFAHTTVLVRDVAAPGPRID
jgi:hypothetical protein